MKIGIISYCDHVRTYAHFNHQAYADQHGYTYIFDIAPTKHATYFAKIDKIAKFLEFFDWVFWVDDDAFFTDFNQKLEDVISQYPQPDFIFCKSPINKENWTHISSGNFFIKNSPIAHKFLAELHNVDIERVEKWWDPKRFGVFTRGDQDAIVYLLHMQRPVPEYTILDFNRFNNRPFHYKDDLGEHFIVHFTGGNKRGQVQEFAKRFDVQEDLIPAPWAISRT